MKPKLILPCAGLGTRVSTPFDKSKELNHHNGSPLIQFSLDVAKQHGLEPFIITRKEKRDLIDHCGSNNLSTMILEAPGKEWSDTILKSYPYWSEYNLFMLPDTRFDNPSVVKELMRDLYLGCNASFGVFPVEDQSKWCTVNNYRIIEKPAVHGQGTAIGCFAFRKNYGKLLFESLSSPNSQMKLYKCSFHSLENFRDLTRGSNIGI